MLQLFVIVTLGALIVFMVAGFKSFKKKEWKKGFKRLGLSILAFFIMIISIGIGAANQDEAEKKKAAEVAAYHKTPDYKAKVKQEREVAAAKAAQAKKDAQEKAKKARVKAKQEYLKELKPEIDKITKVYDSNWTKVWKPTMNAISKGSTDYYTAYNNMEVIKNNYEGGRILILDPVDGMTKEQRKLLKTFADKMGEAFTLRYMAVEKAQEMFNTGTAQPSEVNKMQSYSKTADSSMIEATVALTELEMGLGVKRK